ncbi:MAG TPA: LURP-one-related family protein [Candidatus Fimimonas gallinarum]|uniref:LURP-one-related family protein n=1 Tax=Candidatus Fimimonas gallinarum TaxID=2840821 RepID=A0A9D1J769_9BACT|nr:LURP-one-related family protein [Candidatus Fimimonas gallinarum]
MKVYIKNRVFSLGQGSSVVDENKNALFDVKGRAISITRKKFLYDANGQLLYSIRNKWINFFVHKAYIYDASGSKIATVKDKWFNVNQEYFVLGYKDEIKIQGKFFGLTSQILRNGNVIGTVRRQITFIADAFELEADERDIPFLIALVVALDNIHDKRTN